MGVEEEVAALTARVAELERQLDAFRAATAAPSPPTAPGLSPAGVPVGPPPPTFAAGAAPPPGTPGFPPAPTAGFGQATTIPAPGAPPGPPPPTAHRRPPRPTASPEITTEAVLRWAGLLLVVLAAVFFVATAISRGWIGPELQLLGATAIGVGLLAGAHRLAPRARPWALALACGGAVVLPICAGAAHLELDLVSSAVALVALALVGIGVTAVAWRLDMSAVVGVTGVFGVFVMLAVADEADLAPLVPGLWLVAVAVGASAIGWLRRWVVSRLVVVTLAALMLLALVVDGPDLSTLERAIAVLGILVVGMVAWLGPIGAARFGAPSSGLAAGLDHRLVALVPLWTWATASAAVVFTSTVAFVGTGLVGAVLTVGFVVVTWARVPRASAMAYGWGAVTLALVAIAVAANGAVFLVALSVAAAGGLVTARLFDDLFGLVYALIQAVVALWWTVVLLVRGLIDPLSWPTLLALAIVVALLGAGAYAIERWGGRGSDGGRRPATAIVVPSWVLIAAAWMAAVWWLAAAFVHGPQGQVVVSLLWAVAAIGALLVGVAEDRAVFRILGLVTLALLLTKLLTVDLAAVDALWRVGLFLVVGAGLMRLGYVLPRLSGRREGPLPSDP
ncbi:MAG: DUF2339 domain-containing protein [Actinomycetota bacterium]